MGFSASLSGLNVNQQKLNVIGNNLANINTIGYKASTVQFMDLVSQSVGGSSLNPMQVGLGVTTGSISPSFKQGGIENTGVPTNVAIQGNGFFVVGDSSNRSYTRAGDFSFDADGMLVTSDGLPVQGYTAADPVTGAIITTGQPGSIVVPPGVLRQPTPTSQFGTVTNLDSGAIAGATFTASVQVYDSLGTPHVATITYTNTAPGEWDYEMTVPGEEIAGGTAGTPEVIATGDLTFDGDGKLDLVNGAAAADVTVNGPTWANGATAVDFVWDLVDVNDVATITGFDGPSATSSVTQNGAAAGTINSISINATGEILATFGTGSSVSVGQLAMANFNNPQGLVKLGSNRYGESASAGIPNVGVAGTGGRGSLIGSSLEQSNVDIAQEFTQMILAQRGYQANSKSITVADELLVDTLNLKR
ncbi:MAG TPA: flagellar hook protein FlgE [Vicinamibacterales bacterium]|nr:flagellar hook protein FlgE [Vicinamibacterales bacterium]